jgi:hypothetical protein
MNTGFVAFDASVPRRSKCTRRPYLTMLMRFLLPGKLRRTLALWPAHGVREEKQFEEFASDPQASVKATDRRFRALRITLSMSSCPQGPNARHKPRDALPRALWGFLTLVIAERDNRPP